MKGVSTTVEILSTSKGSAYRGAVTESTTVEILSTSKGDGCGFQRFVSTTVEILSTSKGLLSVSKYTNLQQ